MNPHNEQNCVLKTRLKLAVQGKGSEKEVTDANLR